MILIVTAIVFAALGGVFLGIVWERYATVVMTEHSTGVASQSMAEQKRLIPGIYKHHKGGFYLAVSECRHSETGEVGIVYVSLSDPCTGNWNWRPCDGEAGWYTPTEQGLRRFAFQRVVHFAMAGIAK